MSLMNKICSVNQCMQVIFKVFVMFHLINIIILIVMTNELLVIIICYQDKKKNCNNPYIEFT